jgi:hypothetical protein
MEETLSESDGGTRPRLVLRDRNTGTWQYLFDGSMYFETVHLLWCGDMDGDSIPDFMLSISNGHSGGMMLFLSQNPGKWKFVKLAGMYFWGDCC